MLKLIRSLVKKETRANAVNNVSMIFKSTNQIIEEIHEEFYSEVDKLLSEAKISNSLDTDKQALIDKCSRLKTLGFTGTQEVKEAEEELARITQLKEENSKKDALVQAINYFSFKYPQYKFITEDSVKKICAKYNLIYGAIDKYIGTVPDKNLKQMEEFKIHFDDVCWIESKEDWDYKMKFVSFFGGSKFRIENEEVERKKKESEAYIELLDDHYKTYAHLKESLLNTLYHTSSFSYTYPTQEKVCPLEIAAPLSDFNTKGMELKGFQLTEIHIPDPVVLQPVFFEGVGKAYLIVSAWGQESSDELVVNQKMN